MRVTIIVIVAIVFFAGVGITYADCCQCGQHGPQATQMPTCGPQRDNKCGTGADGLPCADISDDRSKCDGSTGVCTRTALADVVQAAGVANLVHTRLGWWQCKNIRPGWLRPISRCFLIQRD
jgi:hypothetical protein